jgi:glutaminyl-tRNA synthetase
MSETPTTDFIRSIITEDLDNGKHDKIITRFPPEPNGYLHIGHAKSICLNYGISQDFNGQFHLRFDDTNPSKEETEYVESIKKDVEWLGAEWGENLFFASDYFDKIYSCAVKLIKDGKAYVCDLTPEEIREYRGTLTTPGKESPYRNRSIEENLELFEQMKKGDFKEGEKVLRAKIDMVHTNIHMRDPIMYRIMHTEHHRTGEDWNIYPMYDFAHPLEDAIESITHSICTLEFEIHRPLYNWFIENLKDELPSQPRQIEFARLNLGYTVMSKRKLLELVQNNYVTGWDDPRMPTISGMRRRGITAEAIRKFCSTIGVTKFNSMTDPALLEFCIREDLNVKAPRRLAVLDPLKVVVTNYPEGQVEEFGAINNPEDPDAGRRMVKFSRELYIERADFMEDAPRKFFRLTEGKEVRFKYAYLLTCTKAIKDENGEITEIHCTYDPESKGGSAPDGRKVKGTIHWLSAEHCKEAEIRLYDRLFAVENPDEGVEDYKENLNPNSLNVIKAYIEEALAEEEVGTTVQFERNGYFCVDSDSTKGKVVYNRTVAMRSSWDKIAKNLKK